jgi:hypothetical protein
MFYRKIDNNMMYVKKTLHILKNFVHLFHAIITKFSHFITMNYCKKLKCLTRYKAHIFLLLFAGIVLFLSMNRHSRSGYYNYQSEIWADKAGYYVYLPALLKYGFNPGLFPDSIDVKTGNGFQLNFENNTVQTKYFYGVAFMQMPFYLAADLIAPYTRFENDGFSQLYHKFINVAAVFYFILGLVFLWKFLTSKYRKINVFISLFTLFLGTNLFYYTVDETGMSHVYSFFLFSAFLFLVHKTNFLQKTHWKDIILLGICGSLIVMVRPVNAVFFLFVFFLDISKSSEIIVRLKRLLHLKVIIPILFIFVILLIPQLIYWQYLNNSLFFLCLRRRRVYLVKPSTLIILVCSIQWLVCLYTSVDYHPYCLCCNDKKTSNTRRFFRHILFCP